MSLRASRRLARQSQLLGNSRLLRRPTASSQRHPFLIACHLLSDTRAQTNHRQDSRRPNEDIAAYIVPQSDNSIDIFGRISYCDKINRSGEQMRHLIDACVGHTLIRAVSLSWPNHQLLRRPPLHSLQVGFLYSFCLWRERKGKGCHEGSAGSKLAAGTFWSGLIDDVRI
jgi:hypothetical protein